MAGQFWTPGAEGGYLYSDELSDTLRFALQPLCKFRQLLDAREDAPGKSLHSGDTYNWNVYSDISIPADDLGERTPIPESNFTIAQRSLVLKEAGNSVPYTGKLEALAKHDLEEIINKTLLNDARKYFDVQAYKVLDQTKLRAAPTSGTSTTAVTLTTNGATATTNNVALGKGHCRAIFNTMRERNIPAFVGDDYVAISHPTTYDQLKDDLEGIHKYTSEGVAHIFAGEIGRYDAGRFIEQTHIPRGGANDSTTFDPRLGVADEWNSGKSSWVFFIGADTGIEAAVIPEEIRAKIPGDYGRSKGIAWYYLGGFGLVHDVAKDTRLVKWDSAA